MSFGLSHGRTLDTAPGTIGLVEADLGPLPDNLLEDSQAGWIDVAAWFDTPQRPLEIEIGSGKGTFLVQQAALALDRNFIGIEWAGEFFRYAADRVRRHALANVRLVHADATTFLRWRVPTGLVSVVHLYFPDPWPKTRHHKKRMVRDDVLASIHRILRLGGELRVVTDHPGYWAWMEEHCARWTSPDAWGLLDVGQRPATPPASGPFERSDFTRPESADAGELVGTNFERKYRRDGRPFHATVLRRREPG
jgi:tRNA (guanine-N7-)-methyltransferase